MKKMELCLNMLWECLWLFYRNENYLYINFIPLSISSQASIFRWDSGRSLTIVRAIVLINTFVWNGFPVILLFPVGDHVQKQVRVTGCGFRNVFWVSWRWSWTDDVYKISCWTILKIFVTDAKIMINLISYLSIWIDSKPIKWDAYWISVS